MNIAIYAHGGSANHGCEALVRSIIYTLGNKNISYRLLSENAKEDKYYEIDKLVEIISSQDIPYRGWRNFFYKILMKIYKDEGRLIHKTPPGRTSVLTQEHIERIKKITAEQPDITLAEIAERLDNIVCISTIHNCLIKLGYAYKKKHSRRQNRTEKT